MKKSAALLMTLVVLGLFAGRIAFAEDSIIDRAAKGIKKGAEAAGRGIKKGGEAAAKGIKKGSDAAAPHIKNGGAWVGHGLKKTGEKLEKAGKS